MYIKWSQSQIIKLEDKPDLNIDSIIGALLSQTNDDQKSGTDNEYVVERLRRFEHKPNKGWRQSTRVRSFIAIER